jgi:hypothetical protein
MVGHLFVQQRDQRVEGLVSKFVVLVDDRLKIWKGLDRGQNACELLAGDAAVVQQQAVDFARVQQAARLGEPDTVALREGIVLEHERLEEDFLQDGKRQVEPLSTLEEVLHPGVDHFGKLSLLLKQLHVVLLEDEVLPNNSHLGRLHRLSSVLDLLLNLCLEYFHKALSPCLMSRYLFLFKGMVPCCCISELVHILLVLVHFLSESHLLLR